MATAFDVWFVHADTVYKGVPYGTITDWAEQGRLSASDKVRPAGVETAWVKVADHPLLADFLYTPSPAAATNDAAEQLHAVEMDAGWGHKKHGHDEDEDVDMIPLIDISMVLLIFFMMTATVASLSPVEVPRMKHALELGKEGVTVQIDKRPGGEAYYALRIGEAPLLTENNNLTTKEELVARLKAHLNTVKEPPEVRIACHKDLPRHYVHEVAKELHLLKEKNLIAYYGAEVNELK